MPKKNHYVTPLLILGGQENALSITRSLGKKGVPVYVSGPENCSGLRSRFCERKYIYPNQDDPHSFWKSLLLENDNTDLQGCVIFSCSDYAIDFIAKNRSDLEKKYLLEENNPTVQLDMLDKQKTLAYAKKIGCPAPQYWSIKNEDDVKNIEGNVIFPAMIRPIHSHIFRAHYKTKLFIVENFTDLRKKALDALKNGLDIIICEMIPGPDDLLCSYYTYIDENSNNLFKYTKRVIRRHPLNSGGASYHISSWESEAAELGERFFRGIKLLGLGNIEFKRDVRDGQLKIIECNARFTAAQELLLHSGMDIADIIYLKLTGQEPVCPSSFKENLRLWYPKQDLRAFIELRRSNKITFFQWLRSIVHKQIFPYFQISDPYPAIYRTSLRLKNKIYRLFH